MHIMLFRYIFEFELLFAQLEIVLLNKNNQYKIKAIKP